MMDDIKLENKTVLITGATGFIGGRLAERLLLEHKAKVRVLARDMTRLPNLARFAIEVVKGDLTDPDAVRQAVSGCDIIVHCAWAYSGPNNVKETANANLSGTENLLKASLEHKVQRFLHVSTVAFYKNVLSGTITEDSPLDPSANRYAASKYKAEQLAMDYFKKGLPVTVVQPTIVYGPRSLLWTVNPLNRIKEKKEIAVLDEGGLCNIVYIDDLVQGMLLAATRAKAVGERFLITGPRPPTWAEFYGAYEKMAGYPAVRRMTRQEMEEEYKKVAHRQSLVYRARLKFRQLTLVFPGLRRFYLKTKGAVYSLLKPGVKQPVPDIILPRVQIKEEERSVHLPGRPVFENMKSKAVFSSQKAKDILGYNPEFDFEKAMAVTEQWARWANLIKNK